ncbi:hypothetical protein Scep_001200 [Stephania cephalantha]|uniref:Uncharacterized protein n=1 Tax=Stephania cephalantha TaxID=152367 RepID=A0AAP0LBB5_9MAGN
MKLVSYDNKDSSLYIGADEKNDVQLFYYYIKSERDPTKDPLFLWLTGGPGCSAFSALVYEIGPLKFKHVEYNGTLPTLELNPHSWTKYSGDCDLKVPFVGTEAWIKSLNYSIFDDCGQVAE